MKQLSKDKFVEFFGEVTYALSPSIAMAEKKEVISKEKVTLSDIMEKYGIELELPESMENRLKPALEANLVEEVSGDACAACAACAACIFCEEINFGVGLTGTIGTVGIV